MYMLDTQLYASNDVERKLFEIYQNISKFLNI